MDMNKREQELRERMEAAGITPLKSETREIKCEFTEAEMAKLATDIVAHVLEGKRLEDEKKAVTKKLGDLQKGEEEQAQALSVLHKNGFEDRDKLVLIGIDIENKRRIVIDVETGLQLCTEMLLDSDLQTSMKFKENKAKKAPAAARPGEPIAIGMDKSFVPKNAMEVDGVVVSGEEVAEADYSPANDEPKTSNVVTQILKLERQEKAAPGVVFMTSAESKVFYTDDRGMIAMLEAVQAGRGYVAIEYLDIEGDMNKQILKLEVRDLDPAAGGEELEQQLPDGVEEGEEVE